MRRSDEFYREWISKQSWIFAKTYAKTAPHEYIVKGELSSEDQEIFVDFVIYIRENGYTKKFYSKEFSYYDIDGEKYWTMGAPLEETIILNRDDVGNDYGEEPNNKLDK